MAGSIHRELIRIGAGRLAAGAGLVVWNGKKRWGNSDDETNLKKECENARVLYLLAII